MGEIHRTLQGFKPLLAPSETEILSDMFIQRNRYVNDYSTSSVKNIAIPKDRYFSYVWKLLDILNYMKSTEKRYN